MQVALNVHMTSDLETWLQPYLEGYRSLVALKKLSMRTILDGLITWEQKMRLDQLAPSALTVPSGSRIRLDYTAGDIPVLAVRLQEMYGLTQTPSILDGTCPVMLHLLSPASRPVQITRDLGGFWRGAYAEVKKEMKGRYPKHYWPDNPLEAQATRGVKSKKKHT